MPPDLPTRHIATPRHRISRAFDMALAGILALVLSAALLAPGLADPTEGRQDADQVFQHERHLIKPGTVCAAPLTGEPKGCGTTD